MDVFRMKKGGFELSESPRLWYQRFKRGAGSIGGRELALCYALVSSVSSLMLKNDLKPC